MSNNALIKRVTGRILRVLLGLFAVLVWCGLGIPQALAAEPVANFVQEPAFTIAATLVENQLDKIDRDGAFDQTEGKIDEAIGKTQRSFGKVTGQTEGALKETEGQGEQAFGKIKRSIDEAGEQLETTSESLIEKVKDFFD